MKKYSSKKSVQLLAELMQQYNIVDIVLSPGSRNAPMAIHFSEIDRFQCYSIVDERSAAFVALGMAKSEKKPTAICCTSGSAAANYYPAIIEAFYQNLPLLVITADRPTDFVDLFDGQTIRQNKIYAQHSYGDFELVDDDTEDAFDINLALIQKALELCIEKSGPVHINIPLKEPLYELVTEIPVFPKVEKNSIKKNYTLSSTLVAEWNTSKRIMLLVGCQDPNPELEGLLLQLVKNHSVVVLSEATSNINIPKIFKHIDRYIFGFSLEDFTTYAPDLLITIGQNVVSKKVKQFLRAAQPKNHWHIDPFWQPDTYFCLSQKILTQPEVFFSQLILNIQLEPSSYYNLWDVLRDKKDLLHDEYQNKVDFSDYLLFQKLHLAIPKEYSVHFSNSSAIRYAQLFDFGGLNMYCNRGTSGIEGATSTAMGFAMKSKTPTLLITGDIGFFYDINGLWNQYIPPFTRIILFNNGEGNIFKIIPGPNEAKSTTVNEFIATQHQKNADLLAKHFGFSYFKVEDEATLDRALENFFKPDQLPKIMEVCTQNSNNAEILKTYFRSLNV